LKKTISIFRTMIKVLLPLCFIIGGIAGFKYYQSKEMKIKRKPPEKHAMVVETTAVFPGAHETRIHAMGTVLADRKIVLKTRVAGEVVWISPKFVQGGLIHGGETLVRLEPSDYQFALDKAKSNLDRTLADFEIEKGQQLIAKEELKLISQVSPSIPAQGMTDTALALREPQLDQARAAVAGARSDYEAAKLNLERTRIRVPFDALILEKNVDLGSMAAVQAALATLVDVNQYRVEAQVPLDRLDLLKVHETRGSTARINSLYAGHEWMGRVARTTGKTTGQSRMAGVIILVSDPLGLKEGASAPGLLLDDHVDAVITGRSLDNVYALPRVLIRDNNTLWIFDGGRLDIRDAKPVWKEKDRVFIRSGLNPGDRVITSDIPIPVRGMALVLAKGDRS